MVKNRDEILADFFTENPNFVSGHHRQLADWAFDTKYRDQVASGKITLTDALIASRDSALKLLPLPVDETNTEESGPSVERRLILDEMAGRRHIQHSIVAPVIIESEKNVADRIALGEIAARRGQS